MTTSKSLQKKRIRRIRIAGWAALSSLLTSALGFLAFLHIVLPAERAFTLEVFREQKVQLNTGAGHLVLGPAQELNSRGILLFPAPRVDEYGYLYHFADLVAEGFTLVVIQPPLNHPRFESRSYAELTQGFPEIENWILAGHSAGGIKACQMASQAPISHLLLLDSYCDADISNSEIQVFQILALGEAHAHAERENNFRNFLPIDSFARLEVPDIDHFGFGAFEQPSQNKSKFVSAEEFRAEFTDLIKNWLSDS